MTFTATAITELAKPLDPINVKPPAPGKYGEYIEGWKVIEEANRVFGFDGWTRETVDMVEVCRYETEVGRDKKPGWAVGYRAKVRIEAQGVVREGSAVGNGVSVQLYDAIESAVKEAETDAMKRAMMTLGYPFGLALYDKSKANVQSPAVEMIDDGDRDEIQAMIEGYGFNVLKVCQHYKIASLKEIPAAEVANVKAYLNNAFDKKKQKDVA